MDRELSRYVRVIPYDGVVLLFNTINHSLVSLECEKINVNTRTVFLPEQDIGELSDMDFFISDEEAIQEYKAVYDDDGQLIISIETNHSCNLACPYCYQNGKKESAVIEYETLDSLYQYIEQVVSKTVIDRIVVKVLGGEPTLEWQRSEYILNKVHSLCKMKGIEFVVMVDTNGTHIEEILRYEGYDSLVLTVPLVEKEQHDRVRRDGIHGGTYDLIVGNISRLLKEKRNTFVNLRYNVDDSNKDAFESFVIDIKKKIHGNAFIYLNYIMNLGDCSYRNPMSLPEFNEWVSKVALPILIKHRVPITAFPAGAKNKCQCFSRNSLKLFLDGTVGPCAMFFFKERISFSDFLSSKDLPAYWDQVKNLNILETKCSKCDKLFLCNGARYMPCIKSVCKDPCKELNGEIDLCVDDYIKLYYDCIKNECDDLFVGFDVQSLR